MKSLISPLAAAVLCLVAASACAEGVDAEPKKTKDAGAEDAGPKDEGCVKSPKTGVEILNACTDSDVESIDKKPELPLLLKDGGLPPLP